MAQKAKPHAVASGTLDRQSRTYMIGHTVMNKQELRDLRDRAKTDPDLTKSLQSVIIERCNIRIQGGAI